MPGRRFLSPNTLALLCLDNPPPDDEPVVIAVCRFGGGAPVDVLEVVERPVICRLRGSVEEEVPVC